MATEKPQPEPQSADPASRDKALEVAKEALAQAATQLKTAAGHAGNLDETRADLGLLSEEAGDVYTRVAILSLRFQGEAQQNDDRTKSAS